MRRTIVIIAASIALATALTIATATPAVAERCGPSDCGPGETCCNYGCGICTKPGGACIMPLCTWGRGKWIAADDLPEHTVFDVASAGVSFLSYRDKPAGAHESYNAVLARLAVNHRLHKGVSARLSVTGANWLSEPPQQTTTTGFALSLGATVQLPAVTRFVAASIVADAEGSSGPLGRKSLAPVALGDRAIGTGAIGLVLADVYDVVPIVVYGRYLHASGSTDSNGIEFESIDAIDAGASLSVDFDTIAPLALRLHYRFVEELSDGQFREHELGGGVYTFVRAKVRYFNPRRLRLGLDVNASFHRISADRDGRALELMARLDWFWDANK